MKPTIVIGATTGAASMFATMLIGERKPEIATMMGEQKSMAAIGGAVACASGFGIKRSKEVVNFGKEKTYNSRTNGIRNRESM